MAASKSGTAPPPGATAGAGSYPQSRAGTVAPRAGGRTQQGSQAGVIQPTAVSSPHRSSPSQTSQPRRRPAARTAPNLGRTAREFSAPRFRSYQGVILAEFVLAELLAAATPVVTRKQDASSGQYMSPYAGQDMVKMLSIGLLYFLLELAAAGGGTAARLGAWFGALILLVIGLNEGTNIVKVLGIFSGPAAAAEAGAGNITGGTGG